MPFSELYSQYRFEGSHRHEVFYGRNRKKSIELGLVIFLSPEAHNMSDNGIHFNKDFDLAVKRIAQKRCMEFYGWDLKKFIQEFGKNYLD